MKANFHYFKELVNGTPGKLASGTRKQNRTGRSLRTCPQSTKASNPQEQEIRQGRPETSMIECRAAGQIKGHRANADMVEAGTGFQGRA